MRLLLDTHALIWWLAGDRALSRFARAAIENPSNAILVSAVSAFETATKHRLGKLPEADELVFRFAETIRGQGFEPLPITLTHALEGGRLDLAHKDPFDRLLIAQARIEDLVLVSNERIFEEAAIERLW
ncbi:MAG: type II toxin-antitoxin system VapC family toxin [Caulobacteraceae bacterium]